MANSGKGMSIASLVLGIVACVFPWFGLTGGIICLVCAVVGIVLAVMGRKKAAEADASKGLATAGLVLSIIGAVLSIIGVVACAICYSAANSVIQNSDIQQGIQDAIDQIPQ